MQTESNIKAMYQVATTPMNALQCAHKICHSSHRLALGFSLIEVLVSIVVLSFGLLGMVGMQSAALKANREAKLQSSAVVLAREAADMIRGNKNVGILTTANPYIGDFSNPGGTTPLEPATPSYCLSVGSAACGTAADVATAQMTEWLARVDAELPGARVKVCFDTAPYDSNGLPQWNCTAGTGGVVVIKIGWTRGSTNRAATGTSAFDRASIPAIILPVTPGNTA